MWRNTKIQSQKTEAECPIEGNCQVNDVAYKCYVTRNLPRIVYLGLAGGEWKSHFYDHELSFKHKRYSNKTTLSSYMRHLESVSSEALEIVTYQNQNELLNKRPLFLCKCCHGIKFFLKNYTSNEFR